ncbi:MAG: HEAT repeat domain-containing protein, partial [Verrucomicrobiota bacterium]
DPATNEFSPRPEMARFNQSDAGKRAARERGEPMPILGGSVIAKREIGGETWLLGTRGIVIGADTPPLETAALPIKVTRNERREQLAEAERIRRERKLSFEERIAIDNPFVQADALTMLQPPLDADQVKSVSKFLNSPVVELRSTAAVQLFRSRTPEADAALAAVLDDSNTPIRSIAALAQTRSNGELPIDALVRIFSAYYIKNPKWGSTSIIGIGVDKEGVHRALAARGDAINEEVIHLFLRFPDSYQSHDEQQPVFAKLGAAISAKPALAKLLLTDANDTRKGGQTNRDFARDVFRFADASLLPVVHEALKSDNRVIRANAALACGVIGKPESITQLLDALDLESGLSKGAIVWALGELKAVDAIERLADLYLEAQAAEKSRYSSGFMQQQAKVAFEQQRRELSSIDQLKADWDELKAATEDAEAPADPQHEEPLLSPQMMLEALAKIGPEHAQPFYRARINDERDSTGQWNAARQLGYAQEAELEASIAALRLAAANPEGGRTRAAALVSLVQLGDQDAQGNALKLLRGDESASMVYELYEKQIEKRSLLDFARDELQKIANDPAANSYARSRAQHLLR